MKRNVESASGSSEEERPSLKKAKKENFGKREKPESDKTESIDGSKKRITNSNGKIEAPLPELKDAKGIYIGNPDDQKVVENTAESDGDHENGRIKEEIENSNDQDKIREMDLISKKAFIIGRYSKEHSNSCSGKAEVEDILEESICSEEQTAYVDDSMGREDSMSSDKEYMLLSEKLTGLVRDIYCNTRGRSNEGETISKCQDRRNIDDTVYRKVVNVGKGESYSSTEEKACDEFNSCCAYGEAGDTSYETNDEGLGKEVSHYSRDNEIRNEHHDANNNPSFREKIVGNSTGIGSEGRDRNVWEKSKNVCNVETNDEGFGQEESGNTYYCGIQDDERANRNIEEEIYVTDKTDNFDDRQSNTNSEECRTSDEDNDSDTGVDMRNGERRNGIDEDVNDESDNSNLIRDEEISFTSCWIENYGSVEGDSIELSDMTTNEEYSWSDESKSSSYEETDSLGSEESYKSDKVEVNDERSTDESIDSDTGVEMRNGEGRNSSDEDVNDESDNCDLVSDEEISCTSCEVENNSSVEGDSTELDDISTDEEYSWSDESKNNSCVESDSLGSEESDNSGKEVNDESSTDQSSDASSVEDDSTDDSSNKSTEEEYDSIHESENNRNNDWETIRRSLREDTNTSCDDEIYSDINDLFGYRNNREKTYSSTEEENSDCANGSSTTETDKDLGDSKNTKNKKESCCEANDGNDSAENTSSDGTGLERSFDNVLGFLSHRRFSIRILGQETISVSVSRLNLMPLKDNFRESVDGRRKKRVAAGRKENIKTPSVGRNLKNGKNEMRGRNAIKKKFNVENKAAEMSDSGELSDDEMEGQVRNNRRRKSRNRKSSKKIEHDSDSRDENEDSNNGEDSDEGDGDSRDADGEDNGERLEDEEEDDGEEDIGEDSEDVEEEEYGDEEYEDEEEDVEEEENGEDNDEEEVEEEENGEDNDEEEVEEENGEVNDEEEDEEDVDAEVDNEDDSDEQSSDNDKDQWKSEQTKSRTMTKKIETKEQVRGKRNLMKRGKK